MVDVRNFIYVSDYISNIIHQLTDSGQLVTIHTVSSSPYRIFYDDQHGVLYTTSYNSNVITVYRLEYSHQTDSEQDYRLQRLARVLNEKQSMKDKATHEEQVKIPPQGETTHKSHEVTRIAVEAEESVVLYIRSPQHDIGQDLSSTASHQDESHPDLTQREPIQSETNRIAMLKLLQENVYKLKQDTDKTSPLSMLDFARQYAFYTTHQTFLTRRAIYFLVSDLNKELADFVADECYFDSDGIMKCKVHGEFYYYSARFQK